MVGSDVFPAEIFVFLGDMLVFVGVGFEYISGVDQSKT